MIDETTSVPVRPTFGSLLAAIAHRDEALTAPFDADELIGHLRDRVDGLHEIVEQLKSHAKYMESVAEPYLASARAANANLRGLLDRLAFHMESNQFEEVPGSAWRINLQDSNSRLVQKRPPSQDDLKNKEIRKYIEVKLVWNSELVKEDLLSGELKTCDFAEVARGKHVRFWTARVARKRSKPKEIEVKSEQNRISQERTETDTK